MDSRGRSEPRSGERIPRLVLNRPGAARFGGMTASPADEQPRDELDADARRELGARFRIGPLLASRGSANLYDARETAGGRRVALRVVARAALADLGLEGRFQAALAAAARLVHPNAVPIHGRGVSARFHWYAMEFIEGRPLAAVLRDSGPLDLKACLRMAEQVAAALHSAHRQGVPHGNLRPANIFLLGSGWALVPEFAVGRLLGALQGPGGAARPFEYLAPEETILSEPSPAADQYALAVTLRECLAGVPPSRNGASAPVHRNHPLPSGLVEGRPDFPGHVFDALERAQSPRPADRFPTVLELVSALGAAEVGPAIPPPQAMPAFALAAQRVLFVKTQAPARRLRRWRTAAAVIALLAAGEFGLEQLHRPTPAPSRPSTPPAALAQPGPTTPKLPPLPSREPAPPLVGDATPVPPVASAPARTVGSQPRARAKAMRTARVASRAVLHASAPGRVSINSRPWGLLYLDGRLVGNTPVADLVVPPGVHRLRIVRWGFLPLERRIRLAPRQELRMEDLVLAAEGP